MNTILAGKHNGLQQKYESAKTKNLSVLKVCLSAPTIILMLFIVSCVVNAESLPNPKLQAVSAEYMTGTGDMHGVRLAYRPSFNKDLDLPVIGDLRLSWEASINLFDLHGSAKTETTYGASITPVFTKALPSWSNQYPLSLEFGIGVAYVHDEKFGGVDIGSDYQFEDRIGLLVGLDPEQNSELILRYIHYSNGGFNTQNPGLDYISLTYLKRF